MCPYKIIFHKTRVISYRFSLHNFQEKHFEKTPKSFYEFSFVSDVLRILWCMLKTIGKAQPSDSGYRLTSVACHLLSNPV